MGRWERGSHFGSANVLGRWRLSSSLGAATSGLVVRTENDRRAIRLSKRFEEVARSAALTFI